jgi:hypothetical protein
MMAHDDGILRTVLPEDAEWLKATAERDTPADREQGGEDDELLCEHGERGDETDAS